MKDDPQLHKPRGRPRVHDTGSSVSTWLRPVDHDRLIELAKQHEQSVSATVRLLLTRQLR
jgi:hypothetical protein